MNSALTKFLYVLLLLPIVLLAVSDHPAFKDLNSLQISKIDPLLKKLIVDQYDGNDSIIKSTNRSIGKHIFRAIVYTQSPDILVANGIQVNSVLPEFVTVHITVEQLLTIAQLKNVNFVRAERRLKTKNDVSRGLVGADVLHKGFLNNTEYQGEDVIVCIYDTGIDFEHLDFRDPDDDSKSRILFIWDQTLTAQGGETAPSETGLGFGVEYTQSQIEDEMNGVTTGFVRQKDTNGHGTHVAGTAAGNGASLTTINYAGMAPKADLIIIKGGDNGFSSDDVIDGMTYAYEKATALGKPIVINMSLGSNDGPHDDSDAESQATNNFVDAGRAIVTSAGNEGNDLIHKSGTLSAGGTSTVSFSVPSYTVESGVSNDDIWFDLWFDGNGDVTAKITSPNSDVVTVSPGEDMDVNRGDGTVYIANYMDANNSDRYVEAIIYDGISTAPPAQGTWTLELTSNHGSDLDFHFWLHDAIIGTDLSEVTLSGGNSDYTLSTSASEAIIVGSFVQRWYWLTEDGNGYTGTPGNPWDNISYFSSVGPTRDGQEKPDITAPGDKVISAKSQYASVLSTRLAPGGKHHANQGTSMSAPVVTGAIALLLEQNSSLDYTGISQLLKDNAVVDSYTGASVWDSHWGYGKLDIFNAMGDALAINPLPTHEVLVYDQWGSDTFLTMGTESNEYYPISVRFTPSVIGQVTGCFIQSYFISPFPFTGQLTVEIWSDNSGKPGSKMAGTNTVSIDAQQLQLFTHHYCNLLDAHAIVQSGQDYHIVLSLSNSADKFPIALENNVSSDNRSAIYYNSNWITITSDFRIRPVVSNGAGSIVPVTMAGLSADINPTIGAVIKWQTKTETRNLGFNVLRSTTEQGPWNKINSSLINGAGTSTNEQNYEYIDNSFSGKSTVYYKIEQMDTDGTITTFGPVKLEPGNAAIPKSFALKQNYPNPFNAHTSIEYDVPKTSEVNISIFNTRGELVKELFHATQTAGTHRQVWDGTSTNDNLAATGIYFVRLQAGEYEKTIKMLFAK